MSGPVWFTCTELNLKFGDDKSLKFRLLKHITIAKITNFVIFGILKLYTVEFSWNFHLEYEVSVKENTFWGKQFIDIKSYSIYKNYQNWTENIIKKIKIESFTFKLWSL